MMSLVSGIELVAAKGHIQLILGPMFSGKTLVIAVYTYTMDCSYGFIGRHRCSLYVMFR